MQTYFISGSNILTIRLKQRTEVTENGITKVEVKDLENLTWNLQDMYLQTNYSESISNYTYDEDTSFFSFTASVPSDGIGNEYRATIDDSTGSLWNGSVQVFASQSVVKTEYVNQIPVEEIYVSRESENEFIILEN